MSHIYTKLVGDALDNQLVETFPEIDRVGKYKNVAGYNADWYTPAYPGEYLDDLIDRHLGSLEAAHDTLTQLGVKRRIVYVTVTVSLQGNFELNEEQVRRIAGLNAALAVTVIYGESEDPE